MDTNRLWIRTIIILIVTFAGIYLVFGPQRAPTSADFTWEGIKANLAENINLGLDLRGGSYLVMRVKTDDYLRTLTENTAQAALTAAQDAQLPVTAEPGAVERAVPGEFAVVPADDPAQVRADGGEPARGAADCGHRHRPGAVAIHLTGAVGRWRGRRGRTPARDRKR